MASIKTKATKDSKATNKKQAKKSEPELTIPDAWIDELATLEINDDEWSCSIVMIEETSSEAIEYLEHFNKAAAKGNRLAVKVISRLDVVEFVKKNILKEPLKRHSPLDLLCKETYKECGPDFERIPVSLLACLLKYMILEYKERDKHIRANLMNKNKEFEDYSQSLWPSSNMKSASGKTGTTGKTGTSGKSKKSSVSEKSQSKAKGKAFTKLRKRGEEWKDQIWIDDAPMEGPQLYVAITNFYDSSLPLELLHAKMPLDAIVELNVLPCGGMRFSRCSDDSKRKSTDSSRAKLSVLSRALLEKRRDKIDLFWADMEFLKSNLPTSLDYKSVMFLQLVTDKNEYLGDKEELQEQSYKQISHFMYDIFENYTLHKAYLDALEIRDVTDNYVGEPQDMQIYNSIMDSLPHECLTIECVLDAILVQVTFIAEKREKSVEGEEEKIEDGQETLSATLLPAMEKEDSLLKRLQSLNVEYDVFQEPEIASMTSSIASLKHISIPIKNVLIYSDKVSIKTFHLKKDIADYITSRTIYVLKSAWENFWIKYFVQNTNDSNFIKLCNSIIKSDEGDDQHPLNYYVYIMIINCILDSLLLSCEFVPVEPTAHPTVLGPLKENIWMYNRDDLCSDCLREIGSSATFLEVLKTLSSEIKLDESLRSPSSVSSYSLTAEIIANNLFYIEDMAPGILLQNLQMEFSKFKHFQTRYCPFTDQLVIVFHDLFSVGESWEENWIGKLTTKIPPRDFVEYILEEEYSWFEDYINQTPIKEVRERITSICSADKEHKIPLDLTLPDLNFISQKSLKYEHIMKNRSPESSKSNPSQSIGNGKNEDMLNVNGMDAIEGLEDSISHISKKPSFIGFDLGDPQRFQFTGTIKEKLFGDGTKITVQKVEKLYGDESLTLNVVMNGHTLYYTHKPVTPFHMILSSGIVLYFGSPSFKEVKKSTIKFSSESNLILEPLLELKENESDLQSAETGMKVELETPSLKTSVGIDYDLSNFPHQVKEAAFHKIPSVYDLKMSTPSGLHIELVQLQDNDLFYVRQKLLSRECKSDVAQKENVRCYSSDGHIVKFMEGGEIQILGGSGAIYSIYEIGENKVLNKPSEDLEAKEKPPTPVKGKARKKSIGRKTNKKTSNYSENKEDELKLTESGGLLKTLENELTDFHLNLLNFKYTTSDGRRFVVKDSNTERVEDILTMTSVDISKNRVNTERLDGVTSTHHADGSLTVCFPDGSCITSTPHEAGEIFCEWDISELDRWFTFSKKDSSTTLITSSDTKSVSTVGKKTVKESANSTEEIVLSQGKESLKSKEELTVEIDDSVNLNDLDKSIHSVENKISKTSTNDPNSTNESDSSVEKRTCSKIMYPEDGFVVYVLNYYMQHPNYSSVFYDYNNCEVEVKLPFSTSLRLKSDGCYTASLEGVSLLVKSDKIFMNKFNENKVITRSIVVNSKRSSNTSDQELQMEKNIAEHFDEPIIRSMNLRMQKRLSSTHLYSNLSCYLLYSVNDLGNQTIIDLDTFNINELHEFSSWAGIQGDEFCCFVVNRDLSGFRLINGSDIGQYIQFVTNSNGLVRKSENIWSTLLCSMPVYQNESQKWFLDGNDSTVNEKIKSNISTFGRRESWTKPFVRHDMNEFNITESEVMVVRVLDKIPSEESVLSQLKKAIQEFSKKHNIESLRPSKISMDSRKGSFDPTEIVKDPSILHKIYQEERERLLQKHDMFRNDMKNTFLNSLIRQACIKARKIRQKNKVDEFKNILKTKSIPPYHKSCFGQVHEILDEVLKKVDDLRKTPSGFARVASIIDGILNLAVSAKTETIARIIDEILNMAFPDDVSSNSDISVIRDIMNEVFAKFNDVSKQKSQINMILNKPLELVTVDEVKLLCETYKSGSGDCPILYNEEFILEDVLEARSSSINSILPSRSLLPDLEQQSGGTSILHSLTAGAQLALEHCQQEFQWERWNCPDSVFSRKGRRLLTRETGFVSAITAAGIIYSIARDCSRGQLPGCGCQNTTRTGNVYGNASFTISCMENIVFAEKITAKFLEALEGDSKDASATINLHNFIVGKEAVRESLHQECRCQGLTSLCRSKVCHMKVGPFQEITSSLRNSYEKARMVDWNSVVSDPEILAIDQLLYMSHSPDYCQPNNTTGWPGTLGRTCSRARGSEVSPTERRSCRNLCRVCGHVVRRRQRKVTYHCKCTFNWCCTVSCEECTKTVYQHFCD